MAGASVSVTGGAVSVAGAGVDSGFVAVGASLVGSDCSGSMGTL